jgi:DNA-binding phage protein
METKFKGDVEYSISYQDELLKSLTDPEEAAAYLNAALDEGSEELFLLALRNVGEAQSLKKEGKEISLSDLPHILSRTGLRFSLKTV